MTVTYTARVASCTLFGCFLKLLMRWRGSIYKLVWKDLLAFLTIYYILNITYRIFLDEKEKICFESFVRYCSHYSTQIPFSFVLGFYVTIVMKRWWNQYLSIPFPDSIAVFVSANIHGQDERGRVMRRTIMRYVCLCLTMALINISPRVKKRFPNLENLIEAGLLVENEKEIIHKLNIKFPRHPKHWLPIVWATSIVTRARKEGRIRDDFAVKQIIDELNVFRGKCSRLVAYDTISVPLVYTQTVTIAVYTYSIASVMGQQWIENRSMGHSKNINMIDLYFPVFSTLQFFFYMGWLKVAESLINPFGEDDDDFEVNWIIDRNIQVSYIIVDEMHHEHPELIKDQYWDEIFPNQLPYSIASERYREEHPEASTAKIDVPKNVAMSSSLSVVKINDSMPNRNEFLNEDSDTASGINFIAEYGKSLQGSPATLRKMSRVSTVATALNRFFGRKCNRTKAETSSMEHRLLDNFNSTSLLEGDTGENAMSHNYPVFRTGTSQESEPAKVPQSNNKILKSNMEKSVLLPPAPSPTYSSSSSTGRSKFHRTEKFIRETVQFETLSNTRRYISPVEEVDYNAIEYAEDADEFEKLRAAREKERFEKLTKQKEKIARTISSSNFGSIGEEVAFASPSVDE